MAVLAALALFAAPPASALTGEESQFASAHNSIRSQHGRAPLTLESDLSSIARNHSVDMANSGSIWHNPNLGSEVKGWDVVGENVGMGPTVDDLMNAFMNSPEHRSNILDTDYNQFGVGVADRDGTIYVTVVFAHRGYSTRSVTTTVRHTTSTTTRHHTSTPAAPRPSAPAPAAKPAAKPAPVAPPVRTVSMLLMLLAAD